MRRQKLMKFQLPDDWRWDQPREESKWCKTCCWSGSWPDLLHRSNLRSVSRCCPLLSKTSLIASASENFCCAVLLALYRKFLPSAQSGYITFNFDNELLIFNERSQRLPPLGRLRIHSICSPIISSPTSTSSEFCSMIETGSAKSLAWAKARIETCSNAHICHEFSSKDRTLPTRLIEIPRDPEKSGIRLRNSSDLSRDTKYVALSHCWGKRPVPCLTTSKNLAKHLKGICWSSIPQTFRDAVLFTRSLGAEYIWIDSMCIVQGDDAKAEADWSRESARMFTYYSNAHVTLAAASSSDCNGGLFTNDPIERLHLLDFTFRGRDYPLFASETPSELLDFTNAATGLDLDVENKYPLLSRAWAFQERLVSPRVIFFTKTQLIWDCYSGCAFEEDQARDPQYDHILYQGLKQNYLKLLQRQRTTTTSRKSSVSAFEWNHLLKAYSHLQLSEPRDRLPAIAAVAEQILSRKYDDPAAEYLCGLRRRDLHTDLLWMPAMNNLSGRSSHSRREAMPYVAPSWSWASFPGGIMNTAHYESWRSSSIHLVQDALIFNESRRFSRVLGGHIVIEGPVVDCVWSTVEMGQGTPSEECPQILRVIPPKPKSQDATTGKHIDNKQHIIEFIPDYAAPYDETERMVVPDQVQICLLQTWSSAVRGHSGALALCHSKITGTYTRLGARLRERPGADETPPWGLVDSTVFGSATHRLLTLE